MGGGFFTLFTKFLQLKPNFNLLIFFGVVVKFFAHRTLEFDQIILRHRGGSLQVTGYRLQLTGGR